MLFHIIFVFIGFYSATSNADAGYNYRRPATTFSIPTTSTVPLTHNAGPIFDTVPPQIAAVVRAPLRPSVEYNKEFFYFTAPAETQSYRPRANYQQLQQPVVPAKKVSTKKTVHAVPIKSPDNKYQGNAVLNVAKNAVEQPGQTHIYVLSKQPNVGVAHQQQQQSIMILPVQQQQQGPQVQFLKYNSPEGAKSLQQRIIKEYEAQYGGPSSQVTLQAPQQQTVVTQQQQQQQYEVQPNPPTVNFIKYKTEGDVQRIQDNIIRQYGGGQVQTIGTNVERAYLAPQTTPNVDRTYLAPNVEQTYVAPKVEQTYLPPKVDQTYLPPKVDQTYLPPKVDRTYLAPSVSTPTVSQVQEPVPAPTGDSKPVDKNYAKNYLPPGVDVIPGSSYIPLVVRT